MDYPQDWTQRRSYYARFEGGPRDATQTVVLSLDTGEPPDLLLTPGQPAWLYVLAGSARADGSLPYLWMSKRKVEAIQNIAERRVPEPSVET